MALPLSTAQMTCGMSHGKKKATKKSAAKKKSTKKGTGYRSKSKR